MYLWLWNFLDFKNNLHDFSIIGVNFFTSSRFGLDPGFSRNKLHKKQSIINNFISNHCALNVNFKTRIKSELPDQWVSEGTQYSASARPTINHGSKQYLLDGSCWSKPPCKRQREGIADWRQRWSLNWIVDGPDIGSTDYKHYSMIDRIRNVDSYYALWFDNYIPN